MIEIRQQVANTLVASYGYDDLGRRTSVSRVDGVETAYATTQTAAEEPQP